MRTRTAAAEPPGSPVTTGTAAAAHGTGTAAAERTERTAATEPAQTEIHSRYILNINFIKKVRCARPRLGPARVGLHLSRAAWRSAQAHPPYPHNGATRTAAAEPPGSSVATRTAATAHGTEIPPRPGACRSSLKPRGGAHSQRKHDTYRRRSAKRTAAAEPASQQTPSLP